MIKIILITILLLSSSLFAQEKRKMLHKVRAKAEDNIIIVKALLRSSMIDSENFRKKQENYISNVTARACNQAIFNMQLSPFIQKNPIIKFKVKNDCQAKSIQYIVTNNKGYQEKKSLKIRQNFRESKSVEKIYIEQVENNTSKVWQTTSIQDAMKLLYGTKQYFIRKDFMNNIVEFTRGPYIFIESQENLESIAIFSNSNERATIAIIGIMPQPIDSYS